MKFNSIRHKLVLAVALFITALLAVIATGTYLYFRYSSRELILGQQFAMVSREAHNLDGHLKQAQAVLIAAGSSIPPALKKDSSTVEAWLATHLATRAIFSSSLFLLDNSGVMLGAVPARPKDYGASFADRDYFKETTSSGRAQISLPFMSRETKKPVIVMTAPLLGADGSIAGVLCGRLDLLGKDNLLASLNEVKLGSHGYLYLFARDRTMIMHPDPSRIMKQDVKPGMNKLFDWAIEGFEGSGETINSRGLHFLASFKYLESVDWILAANYPTAEAYQPINQFRNFFIGAMIVALLASVALARKLGISISRPLTDFTSRITALAHSDSDKKMRLDESRSDELGLLALSFNMLLDDMQLREQERDRAIEASREAEARNELLLQTTHQGIFGTDENGCFTYVNSAGLAILGYGSGELFGKHSHSIIHHSHGDGSPYPAHECPVYQANKAGTGSRADDELLWRKDGSSFIAELSSSPVIENGIFKGTVVTLSDITERKRAEEARRKLARAVEQCPVTIVITDTDGTIEFVNPHFTELTGYSAEEAIGKNPRVLKSDKTPPEVFTDLWSTITKGKTWEGDFVNKGKDGTLFWEHAVISAMLDENGAITHYLAVKEDVTEKKKILEELTAARDTAEAATLAKSQFLATMSHEIRTPMNGVIGMTGLLLETELTDEQRGYAEIVSRSGENLLSLINDILDYSKIEAGRLDMEMLVFDLRTTLEDTAELLTFRAQDAGLELICHMDPSVPTYLKGDPGRLRQIITNLAGNAIKFTHEGEVVIGAELESEQGEAVTIRFTVRDTGIGIPRSRLAAVFEPFTQADGSTTRKYGGTGLGLAICKQLTALMGGEIGIESEEGVGSTFWFTARFEKQTAIEAHSGAPLPHVDLKGTRILVVDDNATSRKLLATLLTHWGCSYELAVDGVSALRHLREAAAAHHPFQVALLDQEMPVMDGSELGRQIKADPQLQATLLIMVTSLAQRGDAAALEKIGFTGYLAKPVRQSQLYSCIALALDRAHTPDVPAPLITRHTVAEVANRGLRILLAEDNVINQKVAQSMLGKLGYKADVVANGLEAVLALEMIDYDIVLMDCMMPEMDGFGATAVIRDPDSSVRNHTVPIIALTANAMQGDRELCLAAGMDDYLSKPVKKDELAAALEKWGQK
ncbi:MAG TPA: response regulator [Desulfuromonadales bacterium]|nr:response regulator [Desulfuromonadales bacterium]